MLRRLALSRPRFTSLPVRMLHWADGADRHLAGACAGLAATAAMLIVVPALAMLLAGARP